MNKLIDAVYEMLKADSEFMDLLNLTPSSRPEEIELRITRGMEPGVALSKQTVPHVMLYEKPGQYGRNHLVYEAQFCLECCASTTVQAKSMTDRAFVLFHERRVIRPYFRSVSRSRLAHDGPFATGIRDVKGYEAIFDVDYIRKN